MAEGFVVEHAAAARDLPGSNTGGRPSRLERHPFLEWLIVLAKRKSFILKCVCAAAVGSVVLVLLLPNMYSANARVLPAEQHQLSSIGLANQLNLSGALSQGTEIHVAMLSSETVANRLIDRFSLMKVYGAGLKTDARQKLGRRTQITLDKGSVISISVDDRDAQRAADLANGYVEELEGLTKSLAVNQTHRQKEFLSKQVEAVSEQLASAEQDLRTSEEKTGLVLFDPQTKALIEQAAKMRAKVAAQEVHVQWLSSFAAAENPELARANQELAAMRIQQEKLEVGDSTRSVNVPLERMPGSRLEYERKQRDVRFREYLLNLLTQQLQAATVDESHAELMVQSPVQLLDRAVPAEERSAPHRLLIVFSVVASALLLATLAAFIMEKVERARYARKPPARVPLYTFQLREQTEQKQNAEIA